MSKNRSPSALQGGRSFGAVAGSLKPYSGDEREVMPADAVHIPKELRDLKARGRPVDKYDRLYWRHVNEGRVQPPKWSKPKDYKP